MINNKQIRCIIVTFNGESYITRCLDSLKKNVEENKIIVVDNGSSDNTLNVIETNYPDVNLIKLGHNYGFGKANNIGIDIAIKQDPEYILLINQDVYVKEDTISVLITMAERNPQYSILSPMHLNGTGLALDYHFSTNVSGLLVSDCYFNTAKDVYPCSFVNAAAWFVSKKTIQKIGGFDPLFFHYGEDNDYINRIQYHGLRVGVCTKTQIIHDRGTFNAFTGYKASKIKFIETLISLKNINYSFIDVVYVTYINFICDSVFCFFTLNVKNLFIIISISIKTLFHLGKIKKHRDKSKRGVAFLISDNL